MIWIALIAALVWVILSFVVIGDMFRKKTPLGCLGLLLFPILPFIWVLNWYSGRRRIVGPALYLSAAVAVVTFFLMWRAASEEIDPFIQAAEEEAAMACKLREIGVSEGHKYYKLLCTSERVSHVTFSSAEEMSKKYEINFIQPLLAPYQRIFKSAEPPHIIVGVASHAGLVSCHRIDASGVVMTWYSGAEEPCD